MLKTIIFTTGCSLKGIDSSCVACENDTISILTSEGWRIPEEGDTIKEVAPGRWNIIGKEEISELSYNLNNLLSAVCPIDNIEKYYIDAFGIPAIKKAVIKTIADFKEIDYNNPIKISNTLRLSSWLLQRF